VRLNSYSLTIKEQLLGQVKTMNLNPLHYVILTFWHRVAGDSTLALRLFSILIYLCTLPFVFLLARKLFGFNMAAWVAVSLFAVMPYFHYYAQEARYISLCVFLFFANSYFFLRALDQKKVALWIPYIISGILALYASILLGLLFVGQFIFILSTRRKLFQNLLVSLVVIFLFYLPWLLFIINSFTEIEQSLTWHQDYNDNYNILVLGIFQLIGMSRSFASFEDVFQWFIVKEANSFSTIIYLIVSIIVVISIVYTARKIKQRNLVFILSILLVSFLFFLLSDSLRSAGSSLIFRYHYISYSALLLVMAFFLGNKINQKKLLFFPVYIALAIMGILSMLNISQDLTWDYYFQWDFTPLKYLEDSENCLLITDFASPDDQGITAFLMIANAVNSRNVDVYRTSPENNKIRDEIKKHSYTDIYVHYASEQLIDNLKLQFGDKLIQFDDPELFNQLWKIKNPSNQ